MAVEVTCTCETCTDNAKRLGKDVLGARVPDAFLKNLGRTKSGALGKQSRHAVVHIANDPNKVTGEAVRDRTGILPL